MAFHINKPKRDLQNVVARRTQTESELIVEEVFRTNDAVKLSYIRHLLTEAGIEPYILDEHTAYIDGRGPMVPIRVTVKEEDASKARLVLRELDQDG